MKRFYLTPVAHEPTAVVSGWHPSGFWGIPYSSMRWHGTDPETRLVLSDVTDVQHATLLALPQLEYLGALEDLDNPIAGPDVNRLRGGLENKTIPGQQVSAAMRFRNVLRRLSGVLQLQQRVWGIRGKPPWPEGRLVVPGRGLAGRLDELPAPAEAALVRAAEQFRLDRAVLGNAASSMRQVLDGLGEQFESRRFTLDTEWI